jgi:cytochrome c-type biogenesis protein CcmH/NrfF
VIETLLLFAVPVVLLLVLVLAVGARSRRGTASPLDEQ